MHSGVGTSIYDRCIHFDSSLRECCRLECFQGLLKGKHQYHNNFICKCNSLSTVNSVLMLKIDLKEDMDLSCSCFHRFFPKSDIAISKFPGLLKYETKKKDSQLDLRLEIFTQAYCLEWLPFQKLLYPHRLLRGSSQCSPWWSNVCLLACSGVSVVSFDCVEVTEKKLDAH